MKKLIAFILIAGVMTGCSTSKELYKIGEQWKVAPNKSTVTGWTYKK